MVSFQELTARIKDYFRFSRAERQGLLLGVLAAGFIFSFRNWGAEEFDFLAGLGNFLWITLAAGISFFGHIACQKVFALSMGYRAEFRVWWAGLIAMLALCFVSAGYLTLVLAGGIKMSLMVRQRLGEFRYGYKVEEQAIIGLWGVFGSLIMAALFRIGSYFLPNVLFFEKGVIISLVFAVCSIIPLPRLDGLSIFFGSRGWYITGLVAVAAATLLLLWGGGWGLLFGIIAGLVAGGIAILYGSEI